MTGHEAGRGEGRTGFLRQQWSTSIRWASELSASFFSFFEPTVHPGYTMFANMPLG